MALPKVRSATDDRKELTIFDSAPGLSRTSDNLTCAANAEKVIPGIANAITSFTYSIRGCSIGCHS